MPSSAISTTPPLHVDDDDDTISKPKQEAATINRTATAASRPANASRKPSRSWTSRDDGKEGGGDRRGEKCYAVDAEMVTVVGPGELPERRAMVSVGIVNERLETVLYGRVALPRQAKVTDGAFARVQG